MGFENILIEFRGTLNEETDTFLVNGIYLFTNKTGHMDVKTETVECFPTKQQLQDLISWWHDKFDSGFTGFWIWERVIHAPRLFIKLSRIKQITYVNSALEWIFTLGQAKFA